MLLKICGDYNDFAEMKFFSYEEVCKWTYPADLDIDMIYFDIDYYDKVSFNGWENEISIYKKDFIEFYNALNENIKINKNFTRMCKDKSNYDILKFNVEFIGNDVLFTVTAITIVDIVNVSEKMDKQKLQQILLEFQKFLMERKML